jgi:DNA repair exonuclease SbcCD ATPase subunit
VEAEWNLHGNAVRIRRSLRPNTSKLTYLGTGKVVKGKANVAEHLRKLIGINEKVLTNYVFVEQWQTFAFLSDQPAERAKLFSYLCGTEELALIHKALSDFVAQDKHLAPEIDEVEEKRLRLENKRLVKLATELAGKIMKTKMSMVKLKPEKIKQAHKALTEAGVFSLQLGPLAERLANAKRHAERLKELVPTYAEWTDAEVTKRLQKYEAMSEKLKMAEVMPAVPSAPKQPKAGRATQEHVDGWRSMVNAALIKCADAEKRYEQAKLGNSECPTCGTKLKFTNEMVEVRNRNWLLAKGSLNDARTCLTQAEESFQAWAKYDRDLAAYKVADQIQEAFVKKHKLDEIPSEQDIKKAFRRLKLAEANVQERDNTITMKEQKEKLVKELTQEEYETSMEIDQRLELVKELGVGDDLVTVEANMTKAAAVAERLKGQQESLGQVQQTLDEVIRQQTRIRQQRARATKAIDWLQDAEYIRDIMHHTALPRDIAVSRLAALTLPINRMLNQFGMDFAVKPDESLSFLVKTSSGAETTASRLSGGQKMLLAISFWLAINSVFVSDVGFLTLDEPTAGLKRENIQSLAEVIGIFSKSAKQAGRQVIVVTHENALRKVFDQCIELPPV